MCAAIVLVPACSKDEDRTSAASSEKSAASSTTTVAIAEWQSGLEKDCAEANAEFAHLAGAAPQNEQEAVAHAKEVERFVTAIASAVHDSGVPSDRADRADDLHEHLERLSDAAEDLADAASEGDPASVTAAVATISREGAELNPIAVELGVPACGGF